MFFLKFSIAIDVLLIRLGSVIIARQKYAHERDINVHISHYFLSKLALNYIEIIGHLTYMVHSKSSWTDFTIKQRKALLPLYFVYM